MIRHKKMWLGLVIVGTGLVLLKFFAPLSDPLDGILTLVIIAITLTYNSFVLWEERRERQAEQSA